MGRGGRGIEVRPNDFSPSTGGLFLSFWPQSQLIFQAQTKYHQQGLLRRRPAWIYQRPPDVIRIPGLRLLKALPIFKLVQKASYQFGS